MKDSDSAFPVFADLREGVDYGLSRKEYAAIKLKVPRSGDPDIDKMIQESRRDDFAKAELIGIMLTPVVFYAGPESMTSEVYKIADAMLTELEKEAGE
jgi:hypothetical protein